MHTEDLIVNHSCYWKAVEGVTKQPPHLDVMPPFTYTFHPGEK